MFNIFLSSNLVGYIFSWNTFCLTQFPTHSFYFIMGITKLMLTRNLCSIVNFSRLVRRNASSSNDGKCNIAAVKPEAPSKCSPQAPMGGSEGGGGGGKKALVLGVHHENGQYKLDDVGEELCQASGGKISQQLSELGKDMKLGKAFIITDVGQYSTVALASVGPKDAGYNKLEELDEMRENIRWGVGAGVRALNVRGGIANVDVATGAHADAAAEGASLAAWRFQEFKTEDRQPQMEVSMTGAGDAALWERGVIRARAQNWARWLSDMPANHMTPLDVAQAAFDVLCPLGVKVTARDRRWLQARGFEAFLTVARGACSEPVLLELEWSGGGSKGTTLIVAKGVTFDSGGMCLKRRESMVENRGSMAGAAVTMAAFRALAENKSKVNACAVIPLCENMVSGQCMKVGDVVRALNGTSIAIEDTDMEGRLMMADALVYGQTTFHPALVLDVATLTHGVLLATGGGAFGSFSNSETAWRSLQHAGALTGDRPWRFPLWNYYHRNIVNDPAVDLRNKGAGHATPCLGAAFLKNFVCGDWVHMDITGVGKLTHAPAPPYLDARRMSGRPTRTLATFLESLGHERCDPDNDD